MSTLSVQQVTGVIKLDVPVLSAINAAFDTANSGFNCANSVNTVSIAAFNKANSALANATGTLSGDLTISGNIVSSNATSNVSITPGGILIGGQPLSSSGTLVSMNVYTSTQTITIPAAATKAFVTLGGPGGASGWYSNQNQRGNSGTANSVLQSGTQTISTMTAGKGTGGAASGPCLVDDPGTQGMGIGGNILNIGSGISTTDSLYSPLGLGTPSKFTTSPASGYCAGGRGYTSSGGSGGVCQSYLTGLTGGLTLSLTIGSGGASSGSGQFSSGPGANGVCIIQWYT